MEADLIDKGLRLRDCPCERFDWRDLHVVVKHAPMESNLYRAMYPDHAGWTLTNHLLAMIVDVLRWLQWAKTKDGSRGRNRPDPIERPGVQVRKKRAHPKVKGIPLSQMRQILNQGRESLPDRATRLKELFQGKG